MASNIDNQQWHLPATPAIKTHRWHRLSWQGIQNAAQGRALEAQAAMRSGAAKRRTQQATHTTPNKRGLPSGLAKETRDTSQFLLRERQILWLECL